MRELVATTARGRALWGSTEHRIELVVRTTTRVSSSGHVTDVARRWEVAFGDDRVNRREFADEDERGAFIRETLSSVELQPIDPPEMEELSHPLSGSVGDRLSIVDFVWDYLQLRFHAMEQSPLNLYVDPRVTTPRGVLHRGDSGWADAVVGLIGDRLEAVDEMLDVGLVLAFDSGVRLSVPLDGTDASGPEIAVYGPGASGLTHVWQPDDSIGWLPERLDRQQ